MDFETIVSVLTFICTCCGIGACIAVFVELIAIVFEKSRNSVV